MNFDLKNRSFCSHEKGNGLKLEKEYLKSLFFNANQMLYSLQREPSVEIYELET